MKGIILAGGKGTRLSPITQFTVKQLLPVYDKPMIYYPLTLLILAGVTEILIICNPEDKNTFEKVFRDGSDLGIKISIEIQKKPNGIPDAFVIGENFIGDSNVSLILGDNLFFGTNVYKKLEKATKETDRASIFATPVINPKEFGVLTVKKDKIKSIIEKPKRTSSNLAITGLYSYPSDVVDKARYLKKSERGETEITDLNKIYLDEGKLDYTIFSRGNAWFDCGSFESLNEASNFVKLNQKNQGLLMGSPHEASFLKGNISSSKFQSIISLLGNNSYKANLHQTLKNYGNTVRKF